VRTSIATTMMEMAVLNDPRKRVRTTAKIAAAATTFVVVGAGIGMTPIKMEPAFDSFLAILEKLLTIAAVTAIVSFVMLVTFLHQP